MRCPHCAHDIFTSWKELYRVNESDGNSLDQADTELPDIASRNHNRSSTKLEWMTCPNNECHRLIVQIRRTEWTDDDQFPERKSEYWFVLPRHATRPISDLVPPEYSKYYLQAAAILDDSPDASAGLSRRILADLLLDKSGYEHHGITARINAFIDDRANPRSLRENLHYLREIGDFSLHTQKDDVSGVIIEVADEEAEWSLVVLDRLFEFYIVGPHRDNEVRLTFDEKISQAKRKAIAPLPEDDDGQETENPEGARDSDPDEGRV